MPLELYYVAICRVGTDPVNCRDETTAAVVINNVEGEKGVQSWNGVDCGPVINCGIRCWDEIAVVRGK
jgi:hypothetical protein